MTDIYDPKKPAVVYLRPGTKARPLQYLDTVEKGGMLIDGKYAIAMYTSRTGLATGPAGPAGDPGPAGETDTLDTIIASASDEITPILIGGPKTTFRAPYALDLTNGYVRISLTTAPTGADFIVDLQVNGSTLFTTQVRIDANQKTSVGSATPAVLAFTAIPDDAEFVVYVTQVGSTIAGMGLKVAVTGDKVTP